MAEGFGVTAPTPNRYDGSEWNATLCIAGNAMSAPDELESAVWQAIGRYSVEICRPDAELAPPQYLLEAVDALAKRAPTAPQGAEPAYRPALAALMDYKQADEDGVMVLVSRQAIHEVFDALTWHDKHAAPQGAEIARVDDEA